MKIIKVIKNWIEQWVFRLTELDIVPVASTPLGDMIYSDFHDGTFMIKAKQISSSELKECIKQAVSVKAEKIIIKAGVSGSCDSLFEALMHKKVILDVSEMDTSKVTDMSYMFYGCQYFEELDLSGWNTSKVTDMSRMFSGCTRLKVLNLSGWHINAEAKINRLFDDCENLIAIITEDEKILNLNPPTDEYKFLWFCPNGACGHEYFLAASDEDAEDMAKYKLPWPDAEYLVRAVRQPPFYSRKTN